MPSKKNFKPFQEAKEFIKTLNFKTGTEFRDYLDSNEKLGDIPYHPEREYKGKGWIDVFDFIGMTKEESKLYSKNKNTAQKYLPFNEARKIVHDAKLKSQLEWAEYSKTKRPNNIPGNPRVVYKKEWKSFGDWLGTGRIADQFKVFKTYKQAEEFVHKLSLKNQKEWGKYCKSGKLPIDIPKAPSRHYENNGWISWGDWFGTGYIANSNRKYRNFKQARKFVRSLNLKTQNEWVEYCKLNKKPIDIPATPGFIYKDDGWISMSDWLGSGIIAPKIKSDSFLSYDEAKLFVHGLGLKTYTKWWNYVKSGKKPNNIPSNPANSYKNKGWVSWGDFLRGELDVEFLSFEECRDFVHKLGLKSWEEWIEYVKSGKKPKNIPSNPADYYKNKNKL